MSLMRCPRCHDEVQLPLQFSPKATLRCPLCQETMSGEDILSKLPPKLIVVDDPEPPRLAPLNEMSEPSSGGFAGIQVESESPDNVPAFEFEEQDAPQRDAPRFASVESPSSTSTQRRRRSGGGAMPQVLGILLGGLASLPLAQLCLWWFFSTDPVDLGPQVARYVPFIVPAQFRPVDVDGEASAEGDSASRPTTQGKSRKLLGADDASPFDENEQSSSDPDSANSNSNSNIGGRSTDDSDASMESFLTPPPERLDPSLVDGLANPTAQLLSDKTTAPDQIYEELRQVLDGHDAWANPTGSVAARSQARDKFYQDLATLGESLLFVDPADPDAMRAADTVYASLQPLFNDDKLRTFVANVAARHLGESASASNSGLATSGEILSVRRQEDYLVTRIRMNDTSRTEFEFWGWRRPPSDFAPGVKIVVLGASLEDPAPYLGIESESTPVRIGSFVMVYGNKRDRR